MADDVPWAYHSQPMANDFANRFHPSTTRRPTPRPKSGTRRKDKRFNAGSFLAGLLVGGACAAVGLNLPAVQPERRPTAGPTTANAPPKTVEFTFHETLPATNVEADPGDYEKHAGHGGSSKVNYLIQAAAFPVPEDADSLQARIAQMGLAARSDPTQLGPQTWFRVTVGPFDSQLKANRALTRLREMELDAFMIKQRLLDPDEGVTPSESPPTEPR